MKTKIRTFIGLVALGVIGFTNNNATAANNLMSSFSMVETEENLTIEDWMLNSNLWIENSDAKTAKVEKAVKAETENPLEVEKWMTEQDFFAAAESYTASGSDKEIEKYANKQLANSTVKGVTENSLEANNDFFKAAESFTASGSDKEIEKYANKQMALQNERRDK